MSRKPNRPTLLSNSAGQGLTEYLILILLIAVASIAAAQKLGSTIKKKVELAERHVQKDISLEE